MSAKQNYSTAVSLIIILATIYWSFSSLMPARITSLETQKNEFSTKRALIHLKEIAKEPHYVGSENHEEVRNYIIAELEKLGLNVEVQTQVAVNQKWRAGTTTKNILARIKGTDSKKALLLLSHYDSSPHSSLGASDAGSGIVTILEGVRAFLSNNKQPVNDIIILISDAEELGLLGAKAFVKHHRWAKDVGLVLNFEARGSGGPSYMLMETNGGNKNLVKAFNKANPQFPVGNSLLYSIYKMLPNDTDLTVFREDANINGYNFAFLDDHYDYHTAQDNYNRLDKNTLQHQAEYLMPLLNYFADANLDNLSADDDYVFFNLPGLNLVNYPFSWVKPLLVISFIVFFILLFVGFKSKKVLLKEVLIGFIPFLISLIVTGILAVYGWKLLLKVYPQYNDILHGFTYNGHFYITAFIALTLWITLWIYSRYLKKHKSLNLLIAPIFIWLMINMAIAFYVPGAGFFIIPVITGLIILSIKLFSKAKETYKVILFSFLVIPTLLIFAPLIQMFPIGLGLKMTVISSVLTVLVIGSVIPIIATFNYLNKLSKLFLLIGLLFLVSAAFTSKYTNDKKQPNSILYVFDADQNEAFWASYNNKVDGFTKQFLGENPQQGTFIKTPSASKYGTNYKLHKKTELINIKQPKVEILMDTIIDDERNIHIKITPQRKINRLELLSMNVLHIKGFALNGEILHPKNKEKYIFTTEKSKHILSYYFTEEGESLDLKIIIPKDDDPDLELYEASYDLFTNPLIKSIQPIEPRSEIMMPMPFVLNDAIVIKKKVQL
jgi:hypothetical protein